MKTVAIHQPQFMPWLGYLNKIHSCDVFVFLDNVQYKKNEWQNRNRIKTADGPQWLTVPNCYKFPQRINEVTVNNRENWRRKHLQALITNYSKAPYFKDAMPVFQEFYSREWEFLADVNMDSVNLMLDFFKIEQELLKASDMELRDAPNERLVDICKIVGADTYLAGKDGEKYMDLEIFRKEGIKVVFQQFSPPEYPQLFGEFVPCLSAIDLAFNCGGEGRKLFVKD
ncbi:MAG: WbqC family protein [Nitrospinae bacterium]|nr:WbqC family protein [Nitrospinota bacterium]